MFNQGVRLLKVITMRRPAEGQLRGAEHVKQAQQLAQLQEDVAQHEDIDLECI